MKKLLAFALAGIAALVLSGASQAAKPAKAEKPADQPEKPTSVAVALTDESLAKMLTDMGYEFKTSQSKDGKTTIYNVTTSQDGWTFYLQIALSSDKQILWISTSLVTLADEDVPAEALLRLLEENNNIGPTEITYNKQTKQIGLSLPLLNRGGLTPAVFRTYLNDFMANAKNVQKLCDFKQQGDEDKKAEEDKKTTDRKKADKGKKKVKKPSEDEAGQ